MKKGWQTKPFEDCIEAVKYTRKIQRKDFLEDGQFPIVSQEAEFTNGYWDDEADVFKVSTPVVIFGDHTQVLKYVDFDFVLGADGVKILPPRDFLRPKFFFYQLQAANFTSLGYARHYRLLKELEMKYPPLAEQQRIVGLLDEAFEGIATAKANAAKNLQNARALFESHLQSVFSQRGKGWVEKRLSEVCEIASKLVDPRKKEFLDLTHVGAGNIESQTGAFVDLMTAREEGLISGKFLFDPSMVLYSKIRPYLMKVGRPDFSGLCSADMYPLAPFPTEITRDYLFHLLMSKGFTDYAIQGSARAGMPKVNREHLFEFNIWLPPVQLQKDLAEKLDALREETQRLASLYTRKLAALEALKKSLLHRAFRGEL
jgi:type I restriction enzyme, S subunit